MGLDMYLYKKTLVKNYAFLPDDSKFKITVLKGENPCHIKSERITHITEEIGYWRKANVIHNWFVENVQDGVDECQETNVSIDELKELKTLCERVLEDKSLAEDLLPTTDGFFFGSTKYDSMYFEDLQKTIEIIDIALVDTETKNDEVFGLGEFYYKYSW